MDLPNLKPQQFKRFREFVYQTCGIRIDEKKVAMLSHRIRSRVTAGNFSDFDAYYNHLVSRAGRGELRHFLDAVTTNETFFFRSNAHFDWFRRDFIQELLLSHRKQERDAQIRIWSSACSTGEEPYSLAICVAENRLRLRDWNVDIVGTDISEAALVQARAARYRSRSLEEVTPSRLRRWFRSDADQETWTLRDEIREAVRFEKHNLMDRLDESPFDCIFLRNVLIYFDQTSKQKVLDQLVPLLNPGGYLVVGPSEGVYAMLEPLEKRTPFAYQKPR